MTDEMSKPLLPDSPTTRVAAGGFATAILASLGYITTSILEVGRELQQAIDQGNNFRTILEQQISEANMEREKLGDRVRAIEIALAREGKFLPSQGDQ